MASKKRRTSRNKSSLNKIQKLQDWLFRFTIFCLSVVIIAFMYSFVQKQKQSGTKVQISQSPQEYTDIIVKLANEKKYLDVSVEVLNGCGVSGVAQEFTNYLRQEGFDVIDYTNADHFGYKQTMVISRKPGEKWKAREVSKSLKIPVELIRESRENPKKVDVTVIIGADYKDLDVYRSLKNMEVY